MANYEIQTITKAKQNERNVRTKPRKYSPKQELCIEQRLFCNKVIEMTENCAIIVQTTIEANTFWNKRAPSITITDENKTRNASEQEKEFA